MDVELGDGGANPFARRIARDRDAAVLWFAQEAELYEDPSLPATRRLRLQSDAIVPLEEVA